MAQAQFCNRHSTRRNTGLLRRVALASLLLGWSVFWLVAVLQPCCKLAVAQPAAATAGAALHTSDAGHHGTGHHPSDPVKDCGGLLSIAHAASASATGVPAPLSTADKALSADDGFVPLQSNALSRTHDALLRRPPLPPPRAFAAFYQRTARILI